MDIIRLAITCKYCHEILESPVVLPCGESICEKDIATKDSEFCCFSCGKNHVIPVGGFSPNKAFALVLNTRIAELDIGQEQNRARNESFKRVQNTLSELKLSLTDPDFIIVEPIEELKRRVELKKEELVLKIEEEAGTLINELCAFERTCKSNHRTNEEMLDRARSLDDKVRRCEDELEEWRNEMKVLKIDEAKWREVNGICDKLVADLELECEGWKEALLMNKIRDFDYKIAELESVDFDPKNKLDSRILNLKQRRELLDLCDFPFNSNWKLLYRASEHGFSVARFHEKCNNKPNTLTLIESSNGNIFGGFCAAKWSPTMKFIKDKSAFIFSLVNGEETPLKIDIDQGDENCAVQCHEEIGPIFGGVSINGGDRDIYIADQANTNTVSYSDLGRCYKHKNYAHGSNRARCFLAGSHNFQVSNMEVYQRI